MTIQQQQTEATLLKLQKVNEAAKALACAAEANGLTPEEIVDFVLHLAKRELEK